MFLTSLFEPRATLENPAWSLQDPDAWRTHFDSGQMSETNESVNVEKALSLAPVWQAVKMISGDCSKLPLKTFKYRAAGEGKDVDRNHQAWPFVNRDGKANHQLTALQLWRQYYAAALLYENAYIWIDRDDHGGISGLYNLLPDRTAPIIYRGQLWYVTEVDGQLEPLPADDVLHLRGLCWDGKTAPALVEMARHDFGLALAARKFTSKFFANGAQHGGILQVPPGTKKTARDKVEQAVAEKRKDLDRAFKTLVLRDGYKWFSTTVDPEKAQTTELDEQQVRHVAAWFMLAPSRLGVKESISYNSEESAKQDYYDTTLSYWLSANTAECNAKLLSDTERRRRSHVIRYQINALLWADAKTRSEIADKGIQSGRFSPDETRDWEGMNPRPDGEGGKFLRPLNMAAVGDEQEPPEGDTTNNPADDTPSRALDAHKRLLADTLGRCLRRLATHGQRAAKRGDALETIYGALWAEQRESIEAMLALPLEAASCVLGESLPAAHLAVFDAVRSALEGCKGPQAVADAFSELERSFPNTWAAETFDLLTEGNANDRSAA